MRLIMKGNKWVRYIFPAFEPCSLRLWNIINEFPSTHFHKIYKRQKNIYKKSTTPETTKKINKKYYIAPWQGPACQLSLDTPFDRVVFSFSWPHDTPPPHRRPSQSPRTRLHALRAQRYTMYYKDMSQRDTVALSACIHPTSLLSFPLSLRFLPPSPISTSSPLLPTPPTIPIPHLPLTPPLTHPLALPPTFSSLRLRIILYSSFLRHLPCAATRVNSVVYVPLPVPCVEGLSRDGRVFSWYFKMVIFSRR